MSYRGGVNATRNHVADGIDIHPAKTTFFRGETVNLLIWSFLRMGFEPNKRSIVDPERFCAFGFQTVYRFCAGRR